MKYLSLFSGIGGFELGIHDAFPKAECVGYSEGDVKRWAYLPKGVNND